MDEKSYLGETVVDSLTGFKGTCIAECHHLHDTTQCRVVAGTLKDGAIQEEWIPKSRLQVEPK